MSTRHRDNSSYNRGISDLREQILANLYALSPTEAHEHRLVVLTCRYTDDPNHAHIAVLIDGFRSGATREDRKARMIAAARPTVEAALADMLLVTEELLEKTYGDYLRGAYRVIEGRGEWGVGMWGSFAGGSLP